MTTGTTYFVAACGECLDGQCDDCEMCRWHASLPGAKPHEAIWYGFEMGHEQPPEGGLEPPA